MLEVYGPDTDERLVAGELAVFATFIVDDVGQAVMMGGP